MLRDYATSPPEFTFMKDSISITNELLDNIENDLLETRQYINTRKVNNHQTKELMRLLQDDNLILNDKVSNLEHLLHEQTSQLKHTSHILSQECKDQLLTNQSEMERILQQCNEAINEKNDIENELHTTKELCFKLSNELNSNKEIILQNKNTIGYLTLQNKEYAIALTAALQRCSELETKSSDYNPSSYSKHVSNNSYVNSIINKNNEDTYIIHDDQSIDHHHHHNNLRIDNDNNNKSIHNTTINNDNVNYNNNNNNNNNNNEFPSKVVADTASSSYNNDHSKLISLEAMCNEVLHINNQSIDITTINKNTTTNNTTTTNTTHIHPMKASIFNERQLVSPTDDDTMEAYEYIEQEPSTLLLDHIAARILSESFNSSYNNSGSKEVFENIQSELHINHHNIIEQQPRQHHKCLILPHTNTTTVSTLFNPSSTNTTPLHNNSYKPISAAAIHTTLKNDDNSINNQNNYCTSSTPSEEYQHLNPYIDNNEQDFNTYIDNTIDPDQYEFDGEPFETSYYDAVSYDADDTSNNNNDDNINDNFNNNYDDNDNFSNNDVNDYNDNNSDINDYNGNNYDNNFNDRNTDENHHQYDSNINIYSNTNNTDNKNTNDNNSNPTNNSNNANNNDQVRDNEDYNSNYDDDSLEDDHYIDETSKLVDHNPNTSHMNSGRCNMISFYENTDSNMTYNYTHEYNNVTNSNNNNSNQKDIQYCENINNDIEQNENNSTKSDNKNNYHPIVVNQYDNNIILNKTSMNVSIYDMVDNIDDLEQLNLEELSMLSL